MTTRIRVLLCDDHELVRRGVRAALETDITIEVVGEASSADEAVMLAARLLPDVVVIDVRMPGRSGSESCRDTRAPRGAPPAPAPALLPTFAPVHAAHAGPTGCRGRRTCR